MQAPPHSTDAELSLLGSIIADSRCFPRVAALVAEDDFYLPEHRAVFDAVQGMVARGAAIDPTTLDVALKGTGSFGDGEVAELAHRIVERGFSAENACHYAEIVAERSARRAVMAAAHAAERDAADLSTPIAETLDGTRQALDATLHRLHGQRARTLEDVATDAVAGLEADGGSQRWLTGVAAIDHFTGGFGPGQHWVVGGHSQHGKTALACNMALATLEQGGVVVMARYEETATQMMYRLASLASGIPYSEANLRRLSDCDMHTFKQTITGIAHRHEGSLHILVGRPIADVEAMVATERPWLVIYDTLQAMALQLGGEHQGRHDLNVGAMCGQVSRLALTYNHAAVLLSQLRKNSVGLPTVADLRESGAIREAPDMAMLCWWPTVEQGDGVPANRYVVRIAKNRVGGLCPKTVSAIQPGTQKIGERLDVGEATDFLRSVGAA